MSDEQTDTSPEATQQTETTDDAAAVAEAVSQTSTPWQYADGIQGQGDMPEWFKADKYKTVAEQAKGYKELESKLGAFTGAPEKYSPAELKEELKEMGLEISPDDPLVERAMEIAKEMNMSQEGFNKLYGLYGEIMAAEQVAVEQLREEEFKALGNNAQTRLDNLNAWATTNLPADMAEGFRDLALSAKAVQTLERLVSMTRNAPINPSGGTPSPGASKKELEELMFAKDKYGQRKMRDPEYAKMVNEKWAQHYGTDPYREEIGG